ncbi:hypothetical protein O3P69_019181 [Scylla paramamosain]|uniref:Protein kinase domain-containing protein n=1 Tax=Scylla paramamosain TaxID=85552 RepID=A0AAW0SVR1_SCYPA
MLRAVHQIHQHGIIHCDLKPANFLIVDNTVKLIDFGIASSIPNDMTSVVKDSQAGTFNYMSPESLLDIHSGPIVNNCVKGKPAIKIKVKSDVWSLGCILYNFTYGRTPIPAHSEHPDEAGGHIQPQHHHHLPRHPSPAPGGRPEAVLAIRTPAEAFHRGTSGASYVKRVMVVVVVVVVVMVVV